MIVRRGAIQRCSSFGAGVHPMVASRIVKRSNSSKSRATVRSTSRVERPRSPMRINRDVAPITTSSAPSSSQSWLIPAKSAIWSGVRISFISEIPDETPPPPRAPVDRCRSITPHRPATEVRPFCPRIHASRRGRQKV